jgi:hypothetical protein
MPAWTLIAMRCRERRGWHRHECIDAEAAETIVNVKVSLTPAASGTDDYPAVGIAS